jgi:SRSO17 transposase
MGHELDVDAERRLIGLFPEVGAALGNKRRRASFAVYAMGLLGSAERKSAEPIAATATADPTTREPAHRRLLRFLRDSPWSDGDVRRIAARHAIAALTAKSRSAPGLSTTPTWSADSVAHSELH